MHRDARGRFTKTPVVPELTDKQLRAEDLHQGKDRGWYGVKRPLIADGRLIDKDATEEDGRYAAYKARTATQEGGQGETDHQRCLRVSRAILGHFRVLHRLCESLDASLYVDYLIAELLTYARHRGKDVQAVIEKAKYYHSYMYNKTVDVETTPSAGDFGVNQKP